MNLKDNNKKQSGQVMFLTTLFIGSSILIFSAIAGYMMIQRIRATTDIIDSTKAIFAADSGIECMNYKYLDPSHPKNVVNCFTSGGDLSFGDPFVSVFTEYASSSAGDPLYIKSVGISNRSRRAFYLSY